MKLAKRGVTLMELIVGLALMGIALALVVPRGSGTKDNLTSKTAAEELVARLRQARQVAMTKSVPVGVAFPRTPSMAQTDNAYFLEGEVNPDVTERWKIQQSKPWVAYFTGGWAGPSWAPAPVMKTTSQAFDPANWFVGATPPEATVFIFTPSGNAVSEAQAADGKFRIVVGMGLSTGGSTTLFSANSPYTVWISPSGEIGLEKGVYGGAVTATTNKDSSPLAPFVAPAASGTNSAPVVQIVPPNTSVGAKAYPNNVNPKTNNGNIIDLDAVLTLEVRVKDADGDPPYFEWKTVEAAIVQPDGVTFNTQTDMDLWGGRFSNDGEVRMEWDAENQEWVGRDTWAPATGDLGGNRYKLVCYIRDRKGGTTTSGFPVDGNYLVTTKEPWVLYKSWNAIGRTELWKMTLDGLEHSRVVSFGYQDVDFGQWSPSGAEIIVGAADGVYRVSADGGNLSKMAPVGMGGPIDGCCLAPAGDALFYLGGPEWGKKIKKIYFDPNTGAPNDVPLGGTTSSSTGSGAGVDVGVKQTYDLSAGQYGDKVILLSSFYWNNTSSFLGTGFFKKKKKRAGGLVVDAGEGTSNLPPDPQTSGILGGLGQGEGGYSGTKSAWRGVGMSDTTSWGLSLNKTDDTGALAGYHILYGSGGGEIHARETKFEPDAPPYDVGTQFKPGDYVAGYPKTTGIGDLHHPKYASQDRQSLVFVSGRGTASRIYYWEDVNNPSTIRQLPLASVNRGATQPTVSRPR